MTSTALAVPESPTTQALAQMEPMYELAEKIHKSPLVPDAYRGKPADIMLCFMHGAELGLSPVQSLQHIFVDKGRVGITAMFMRAALQREGHEMWIEETSSERCVVAGRRKGSEHVSRVTWTMEDARRAQLDKKNNWRAHPAAMLLARASAQLARIIAADALVGIPYSIEELQDGFEGDDQDVTAGFGVQPADAEPARPKGNVRKLAPRKMAPGKKAASAPPVPPRGDGLDEFDDIEAEARGDVQAPAGDPDDEVVEAEIVEDVPADVEQAADERGPSLPPDRALAARYRERGLPEEHRHGFYLAVTGGAHRSGKTMGAAEVAAVFDVLNADGLEVKALGPSEWEVLVDGEAEFWHAEDPPADDAQEAEVVPLADDHHGWDQARWKAEAKAQGLSAVDVLRHLSKFRASDPTIPEGDTSSLVKLAASTSSDLKDEARRFIESGGATK